MIFYSIDIETGGLALNCSVLEVGIVRCDTETIAFQTHSFLVHNPILIMEPYAARMHAQNGLLDELIEAKTGVKIREAGAEINRWLALFQDESDKVVSPPYRRITAAGKNFAEFDGPRILHHFKCEKFWRHRILDPGNMYIQDGDNEPPNMTTCLTRAGLKSSANHRALDDAVDVAKLVCNKLVPDRCPREWYV